MTLTIGMAEATRLTRLGKLTEAMAILKGDRPVDSHGGTSAMGPYIEMTQTAEGAWEATGSGATQERPDRPRRDTKPRIDLADLVGKFRKAQPAGSVGSNKPQIPEGAHFSDHTLGHGPAARRFKLYVPSIYRAAGAPLIVMLHGCTQSPDDFAVGTGMNALAEQHGFLVLYPEQSASANLNRCWNWFNEADQRRDRGEPDLVVRMVRQVMTEHAIDARNIFVAGLSAGGAMAAILAAQYPDVFSGVAVHSGLAVGAAHDMASAFAAMNQGAVGVSPRRAPGLTPTIVFHGDADGTVHSRNGHQVVEQVLNGRSLDQTTTSGQSGAGRRYSRTVYKSPDGASVVEHWVLHGAGHAWSGGDAAGTYTDNRGPSASEEMVRFFLGG